ncbi:hypothetical protein BDV35DRAFT_145601 [Aspergillus flavus]|uniref:Uncharacterized protein n=1 Tax=Aspergillus flavus TaxID=5059 RepID=A0A5N6GDM3_ASPFL|nr:hypothetical protein BDV35DRAFT_145601 [Aspergillus flavus]
MNHVRAQTAHSSTIEPSFQIQYAAAGQYQLGTIERRFHIPVETLLGCTEGVVALLQYGEILRTIPYVWRLLWVGPGRSLQRLMEMTLNDGRAILVYDFDKKIDISEEVLRSSYVGSILLYPHNGVWVTLVKAILAGALKNFRGSISYTRWRGRRYFQRFLTWWS